MEARTKPSLSRLEFMILDTLHYGECRDTYHSMTITELMEENEGEGLGIRGTVYRKLKKLVKGCMDNHADTFYLLEKGIAVVEGEEK